MNNMTQVYNSANGELFSSKEAIRYYYPSIFALEEISFYVNACNARQTTSTHFR